MCNTLISGDSKDQLHIGIALFRYLKGLQNITELISCFIIVMTKTEKTNN